MTDPLELNLPDTTDLDDGDVCIDARTGMTHIIHDGRWCLANLADRITAQGTLERWKAGQR